MAAPAGVHLGQIVGSYRLLSVLGTGSSATVYLGNHVEDPGVLAAVKVLDVPGGPEDDGHSTFQRRFEREARTASKLHHPHILPVLDYGQRDGVAYLISPVVVGGTIATRLSRPHVLLSYATIESYLAQIASALDYVHGLGLVHRDVKPANMLVDVNSTVFLADFGVTHVYDKSVNAFTVVDSGTLTTTGQIVGTPLYMAPEQIRGEPVKPATDVYALGVVLYQLVTGSLPFQGDTALGIAVQHILEAPRPPHLLRANLPPAAEAVVLRAMAKEPAERFPSAGILAQAFAEAIEGADAADDLPNEPDEMTASAEEDLLPRVDPHFEAATTLPTLREPVAERNPAPQQAPTIPPPAPRVDWRATQSPELNYQQPTTHRGMAGKESASPSTHQEQSVPSGQPSNVPREPHAAVKSGAGQVARLPTKQSTRTAPSITSRHLAFTALSSLVTLALVLGAVVVLNQRGCSVGCATTPISHVRLPVSNTVTTTSTPRGITAWSTLAANLNTARLGLGVVSVDTTLYAIGGKGGQALGNVETYTPGADGTWTTVTSSTMQTPRYKFAVAEVNGTIYVMGGKSSGNEVLSTVEAYTTATQKWSSHDPVTQTPIPTMPTGVWRTSAVAFGDKIYVFGGLTNATDGIGYSDQVQIYDPHTNTWSYGAKMHTARAAMAVVVGQDQRIYVIGGENTSGALTTVEVYSPTTNTWTSSIPQLPSPRTRLAAALGPDGTLYAIGGLNIRDPKDTKDAALNTVERYLPSLGKWESSPPLQTARDDAAAITLGGKVYVIGGENNNATLPSIEVSSN